MGNQVYIPRVNTNWLERDLGGLAKGNPFRPHLLMLKFKKRRKSVIPDIVELSCIFSMTETLYATKFAELISPYVKCFPFMIGDVPYIAFRPTVFLPLMDEARSDFHILPSGNISGNPPKVILSHPPAEPLPIFGIEWQGMPKAIHIVSEEFKAICDEFGCEGVNFIEAL